MMPDWIVVTAIACGYLLITLVIGLVARDGSDSSQSGYVAGNRQLGLIMLYFIMAAEVYSAFSFLGGPSWAYTRGAPVMYIFAYQLVAIGTWWILGPRLRALSAGFGHLTQADLLADRYRSRWLPPLIALVSIAALLPYLTIQITGAGLLFQAVTEGRLPFWLGALAAFVVVAIYVYVSGLRGIGWTSLVQGVVMLCVAWFMGISIADRMFGGVESMFQQIARQAPQFLTVPGGGPGMNWPAFSSAVLVSGLGAIMWPHLFMKFYTANSDRTIKRMVMLYPLYNYLALPLYFVGFAGVLLFAGHALADPDRVLLKVVTDVAHFSPVTLGLLLSGALAAAMSTGANLAHSAATIAARDLIGRFVTGLSDAAMVRLIRVMVLVMCALAYGISLLHLSSLVTMLLTAYGIIVQLLPMTVALMFWPRANLFGAFAGLIVGAGVLLLFSLVVPTPLSIRPGIWALVVNTLVLVVGSVFGPGDRDRGHAERFVTLATPSAARSRLSSAVR